MASNDSVGDKVRAGTHVFFDYIDGLGKIRRLVLAIDHPLAVEAFKQFT